MELEGSQNRVGRETEWRWKRDGIAVEGSWELVGQWMVEGMGLTGLMRKRLQALAQYPSNSWTGCCCGCEGKC